MPLDQATKAEYDRIAREMGDDRFGTRRELNHLPSLLQSGETVLAFASGLTGGSTWLIVLTDRRILLVDKGLFYGLKQISIDLDKVNSIEGRKGMLLGAIKVHDGGQGYQIDNVPKKTVMPFITKAQAAVAARRSGPSAGEDRIGRLERLARLRSSGTLTEAEYETEKARILGS